MQKDGEPQKGLKQMLHVSENFMIDPVVYKEFLSYVDNSTSKLKLEKARVSTGNLGDGTVDTNIRKCNVTEIKNMHIKTIVCDYVNSVNADTLGFDLYPFQCEINYAEYEAKDEGHFSWHPDVKIGTDERKQRKWSASLLLNNYGTDYEGGEFEMKDFKIDKKFYKRGTFLLFPSYEIHRVKPVTKGTRKVLIFFFHGPRWR